MDRCLYCYKELDESEKDFHIKCVKTFFKTKIPPIVEYALEDMYKLAKMVVKESVTIPGVQSKLSMYVQKVQNEVPKLTIVGLWGKYIFKPPSEKYRSLPENEDLTMHLASLYNIDVVPHSLIKIKSGEIAYISQRIDRLKNRKLHMEDMCQLTERLTEDKYKGSMEQIGRKIIAHSTNSGLDVLRFFEIALFSFITGNADMHLKNFSLINQDDEIKLSPAYDLLSTRLVIPENKDSEEMALTVNGKKSRLIKNDFLIFGECLRLNQKQMDNVFEKFTSKKKIAKELIEKSFLGDKFKDEYKNLIDNRYARLGIN